MKRYLTLLTVILCAACSSTAVQTQESRADGAAVFTRLCAECHEDAVGRPGTQQLGWTRGAALAVLEQRTDLSAEYIKAVVRNGLLEMPAFFPTELPDEDLEQLAQYLTRSR